MAENIKNTNDRNVGRIKTKVKQGSWTMKTYWVRQQSKTMEEGE